MNELQETIVKAAIPPGVIKDNAAFVSNVIDRHDFVGCNYIEFHGIIGVTDKAMTALKVMESDIKTDDVTFGGTPALVKDSTTKPSATDDGKTFVFGIDLRKTRQRFFQLQATGGGFAGQQGAELMQMAVSKYGLTDDQAVNMLSSLGNSGFSAGDVGTLMGKGADQKFLSLLPASKGTGLSKQDLGHKSESVVSALMATDAQGEMTEELAGLGLTDNMDTTQRLEHLLRAQGTGAITKGQLVAATGGNPNQAFIQSVAPALLNGKLADAQAELMKPTAAREAVANRMASPFAQAETIENLRLLDEEVKRVKLGQTNFGIGAANFDDGRGNLFGVPDLMRTVRGAGTTDAGVKAMPAVHLTNIKGRLGLLPGQDQVLPQIPRASLPGMWIGQAAAQIGVNTFHDELKDYRQPGPMPDMEHKPQIIINYINSNINSANPLHMDSGKTVQE